MKRRLLILVGVLLVLFIGPMSFSNVSAATYEDSSESIYSFSETLEDDVLFYPDGYYDPTPVLASAGGGQASNNDWVDTWVLDNSSWSVFSGVGIEYAYFATPNEGVGVEGFEYSMWARAIGDPSTGNISYFSTTDRTTTDMVVLAKPAVTENYTWFNGSIHDKVYKSTQAGDPDGEDVVLIWIDWGEGGGAVQIDYMEIRFHYLSLRDNNYWGGDHYGDSFWNVSDWDFYIESSGLSAESFTTDDDVGEIQITLDDTGTEYVIYEMTDLDIDVESYIELRFKVSSQAMMRFKVSESDYASAVAVWDSERGDGVDTWTTLKAYIPDYLSGNIAGIWIVCDDYANGYNSGTASLFFDYLRIGPSDEMGWQHDGSVLEGVTYADAGGLNYTASTDRDIITLGISSTVTSWSNIKFNYDLTSTGAKPERDYYQFLEIKWRMTAFTGNYMGLRIDYDDYRYSTDAGEAGYYNDVFDWTVERINLASFTTVDVEESNVRIIGKFDNGEMATVEIDYIKFYSIANFSSYTDHADIGEDDYFYTDSGILYVEHDESLNDYMRMNYDPLMDIDFAIYDTVNSTVFKDGSQADLVGYNWIDSGGILQDSWTAILTQDCTGNPYLKIDDAGSWEIHDLVFYGQVPDWMEITNVDVVFFVSGWHIINSIVIIFVTDLATYTINGLFIFLGLAMIPTSTLYLAKGGREEMNTDKLLIGLLIFIIGVALLVGGIFA